VGGFRWSAVAPAAASLAVFLTACMTGVTSVGSPEPSPPAGTPGPPATAAAPLRPDHVVIVVLENKERGEVMADAPFLASLAATGASLTDMHAETHPSQPNYLALFSGDTQGVDDDSCPHTFPGPSLGGELLAAGFTFAAYSEDLPKPGFTGCTHEGYARKHAPWADFTDVPAQLHQPLTAMPSDFTQLPTVSFVIPNLCHDMHDCSIAEGDAWMREHLGDYATWAGTHNSLLLITFDESETHGDPQNHIATIAVGQGVATGPYSGRADHYSLLRTLQDLYGLPPTGHSADATPLGGLWHRGG
jgi:phosphatidylinositol-3-phosphatase